MNASARAGCFILFVEDARYYPSNSWNNANTNGETILVHTERSTREFGIEPRPTSRSDFDSADRLPAMRSRFSLGCLKNDVMPPVLAIPVVAKPGKISTSGQKILLCDKFVLKYDILLTKAAISLFECGFRSPTCVQFRPASRTLIASPAAGNLRCIPRSFAAIQQNFPEVFFGEQHLSHKIPCKPC